MTHRYDRLVPRPLLLEKFFDIFGRVDQHDHFRQGSLRLEEVWKTQTWWHRIVATILGVIFTDCYLAYRCNELKYQRDVLEFDEFLGKLAYQLIFNPFYNEERQPVFHDEVFFIVLLIINCINFIIKDEHVVHSLLPIYQLPQYTHRNNTGCNLSCSSCKKRSYYYCVGCTNDINHPKAFCGFRTGRDCFAKHVKRVYREGSSDDESNDRQPLQRTPASRSRRSPRSRS